VAAHWGVGSDGGIHGGIYAKTLFFYGVYVSESCLGQELKYGFSRYAVNGMADELS
jgi:hypothetical protein